MRPVIVPPSDLTMTDGAAAVIDTSITGVDTARMAIKAKRTYNLNPEAVAQVRDLAARLGIVTSQDGVVELAIERLYREVQDKDEAALWSKAADDPEFRSEMRAIATTYGDRDAFSE